ncbi:hypothetical protein QBC40DRAFT_256513 [Triangularia verruculosa]|uniref:Uncharacterized protein n=1 Tax=Triangularia verruculosa TaxID=2587418 RepID=A0AAN7AR31_9PEZI|nr:hypothetical protein QBC40DRAFT_256513 [Triangularia verruculosa]
MCHYITQVYPCGYQNPIILHHTCFSEWSPAPRKQQLPCPLEKSTLETIKIEHRADWEMKDTCCETCDRDECKIWRLRSWEKTDGRRGGTYLSYKEELAAYREAKRIVLGTGGKGG